MGLLSKIANSGAGKVAAAALAGGAAFVPNYELLSPPPAYAQASVDFNVLVV